MTGGPASNIYGLADRLGVTPAEIRAMPHRDLVGMVEYYRVKAVLEDLNARTEAHRAGH